MLHYQPQVAFRDGAVARVEALVRWHHPRLGLVPPSQFIPLAEHTGLIKPISLWVLNSALAQCKQWSEMGLNLPVAVNLSARELFNSEMTDTIAGLLDRWGMKPTCLEVEITESTLMDDPVRAMNLLTGLSREGVRLGIDDFGAGYSSLSHLAHLPVDEIKIDRSFVLRMATVARDKAIVRSTINLAHDLGLTAVAEGVEDEATLDLLRDLDCDLCQGYYLSYPLPAPEIATWLKSSPWVGNAS
jgi:diguanylate cyclase